MMTIIYMDVAAHTTVHDHQITCCCLQEGRGGVNTHTRWLTTAACTKDLTKQTNTMHPSNFHTTCFSFQKSVHHYRASSAALRHKAERLPTTCTASMQRSSVQEVITRHETSRNNAQSQQVLVSRAKIHTHTQRPSIFWFP